jgi:hypothetical protein
LLPSEEDLFMFKRLLAATAAVVLLAVSGTAGQATAGGATQAEGRALAAQVMARYGVSDLFDDVTGADGIARLRLRRSGLICAFPDSELVKLINGLPRGEAVTCGSRHDGNPVIVSVFPADGENSLEPALNQFASGVGQSWENLTPTGPIAYSEDPGQPRLAHRAYTAQLQGKPWVVHIHVAIHGPWLVAQAAMAPAEKSREIAAIADAEFRAARRGVGRTAS